MHCVSELHTFSFTDFKLSHHASKIIVHFYFFLYQCLSDLFPSKCPQKEKCRALLMPALYFSVKKMVCGLTSLLQIGNCSLTDTRVGDKRTNIWCCNNVSYLFYRKDFLTDAEHPEIDMTKFKFENSTGQSSIFSKKTLKILNYAWSFPNTAIKTECYPHQVQHKLNSIIVSLKWIYVKLLARFL